MEDEQNEGTYSPFSIISYFLIWDSILNVKCKAGANRNFLTAQENCIKTALWFLHEKRDY